MASSGGQVNTGYDDDDDDVTDDITSADTLTDGRKDDHPDLEMENLNKGYHEYGSIADGGERGKTKRADGSSETCSEKPEVYKSRWRSIRVMYYTMFVSNVSLTIVISSIYPYLKTLDPSASTHFLGWIMASYSLTQVFSAPMFGTWSNCRRRTKEPLAVSILLDPSASTHFLGWIMASYSLTQVFSAPMFGTWSNCRRRTKEPLVVSILVAIPASVLYMYLESIPTNNVKIFMLIARALVGFGSGNIAIVRSYVAQATTLDERTSALASMTAFQTMGFIVGPLLQTAFVAIGYPGPVHVSALHVNMYTCAAGLCALLEVVDLLLIVCVFKEHSVADLSRDQEEGTLVKKDAACTDDDVSDDVKGRDYVAVFCAIAIFFTVMLSFIIMEVILTPLTMHMFAWGKSRATLYVGISLGASGVLTMGVYVCIKILSKRFNERYVLLGGFIFYLAGFFAFIPWGHDSPTILETTDTLSGSPGNVSLVAGPILESVGCPAEVYTWCRTTPALQLWQYVLGSFLLAIGYPTSYVMAFSIYSKILGPQHQGIWMGVITAAGSGARALGPIFVAVVYQAAGPRGTFGAITGIVFLAIIGLLVVFRRLVPYADRVVRNR